MHHLQEKVWLEYPDNRVVKANKDIFTALRNLSWDRARNYTDDRTH